MTDVRVRALELYQAGVGYGRIRAETGAEWRAVKRWASEAGLPARPAGSPAVHTEEAKAEALRLYDAGTPMAEIQARTGVQSGSLSRWQRDRGAHRRSSRTTRDDVARAFLEVGSIAEAARRLGVSKGTVQRHLHRAELQALADGDEERFAR